LDPNGVNNSGGAFSLSSLPLNRFLWIWLNKRKIEPNTIIKFGLGFIFLGLGYYFICNKIFADFRNYFTEFLYIGIIVITLGEFVSPIGLSIMTKLSPKIFRE
jgi:POT family proton-dependent oligopeptide transporter